jgi:hypothetical protein
MILPDLAGEKDVVRLNDITKRALVNYPSSFVQMQAYKKLWRNNEKIIIGWRREIHCITCVSENSENF